MRELEIKTGMELRELLLICVFTGHEKGMS